MEVVILGSGAGEPSADRGAPGVLIKARNDLLLFDLGPGTLRQLSRIGIDHRALERVFFTHLHIDHISDLSALLFASHSIYPLRNRPLSLYGPPGFNRFLKSLLRLYGEQIAPQNYRLTPYELWDSKIKVNDWTLRTRPLCHIVKSIGYRLELSHQSLVYSGDTGYCEEVVELARGADLLILECSFPESVPGHLTPLEAGRIAQEAGSRRLVLVHLYPVCVADEIHKECQRHFSGQVTVASDLLRITI